MILVTGATGFLGRAVCAALGTRPHIPLQGRRAGFDLAGPDARYSIGSAVHDDGVDTVIHLAYPGTDGIGTALTSMADLVHDQLLIDLNVIDACARAKIAKLICVGSVCSYPEHAPLPAAEDDLWSGRPEYWNEPYGQAKRMLISLLDVYRRQYGLQSTALVLGNLYGPGDRSGHVIPATIRKCFAAKAAGAPSIAVWGSGHATREFLYVEDAARAIVEAADAEPQTEPINIVTGEETPLAHLVGQIARLTGYTGAIRWDATKPDGQPRRNFSYARARRVLGWAPTVALTAGLANTVNAWQEER